MNSSFRALLVLTCILGVPASVQAADDAQCRASATQTTGYTPGSSTPSGPDGDRLAGAGKVQLRVRSWAAHKPTNTTMRPMPCRTNTGKTRPRATPRQEWLWPDRVIGAAPRRTSNRCGQ